jgi:hypothetical protein
LPNRAISDSYIIESTKRYSPEGILEYSEVWPGAMMQRIIGLFPVYNSATSIAATRGEAYIPDSGIVSSDANAAFEFHTPTMPSLAANTLYYCYFYAVMAPAIGAVEVSTAAPESMSLMGHQYPSSATFQKLGDASRRYVGAYRTNAAGQICKFTVEPLSGRAF